MARSPRRARAVIDATLQERLESLAGAIIERMPQVGYPLVNKLTSARILPPARLPEGVVTIGSTVLYREDNAPQDVRVTLCWPENADISQGRVSVLTPIGAALLGLSAGDRMEWETRAGSRRDLTVLEVAPPAAEEQPLAIQG